MTTSKEDAFDKITNEGQLYVTYNPSSESFRTAQVYYVIVENNGDSYCDFTLLISQKHSIIEMTNGVAHKTTLTDAKDVSRNFVMHLPNLGENTLTLQVQPVVNKNKDT